MAKIENYLLGMDCGTTNIKAIILAEDGTVVAESSRPSKFLSPGPNMQEQDANEWWQNTVEIFRALRQMCFVYVAAVQRVVHGLRLKRQC